MPKEKRRPIKPERKIEQQVFDPETMYTLHKLIRKEYITEISSPIAVGKESNVFRGACNEEKLALKIYRIETSSFKNMLPYIQGDPRFHVKKDKKSLVYTWAKKEFRNLRRAYRAGVRVPKPKISMKNILVMEFIGEDIIPAPMMKDVQLEKPEQILDDIIENNKKLYKEAGLVHGDLSEFNILMKNNLPYLIDMGQAVVPEHPMAMKLLRRDAEKMARFFSKLGVKISEDEILNRYQEAQ